MVLKESIKETHKSDQTTDVLRGRGWCSVSLKVRASTILTTMARALGLHSLLIHFPTAGMILLGCLR